MSRRDPEQLGILAHELRSPVAALTALAEASSGARDSAVRRRMLELSVAAARDIERLVSDPELFSLRLEPVDLAALVNAFSGPSVTVAADGEQIVRGDPTRLRQAISNLVANGLRHGTHVALEVTEEDDGIAVAVADDGPGLEPGIDPFARGSSGVGSTGYGLWLARAIAEAHGGTLELADAPGTGGRLRLSLPRASV